MLVLFLLLSGVVAEMCVEPPYADPTCTEGKTDGLACCHDDCIQCGGSGCTSESAGEDSCCFFPISTAGKSCDENMPPCMMEETPATEVCPGGDVCTTHGECGSCEAIPPRADGTGSTYSSTCEGGAVATGGTCTLTCNTPGKSGVVVRSCVDSEWDSNSVPVCSDAGSYTDCSQNYDESVGNACWAEYTPGSESVFCDCMVGAGRRCIPGWEMLGMGMDIKSLTPLAPVKKLTFSQSLVWNTGTNCPTGKTISFWRPEHTVISPINEVTKSSTTSVLNTFLGASAAVSAKVNAESPPGWMTGGVKATGSSEARRVNEIMVESSSSVVSQMYEKRLYQMTLNIFEAETVDAFTNRKFGLPGSDVNHTSYDDFVGSYGAFFVEGVVLAIGTQMIVSVAECLAASTEFSSLDVKGEVSAKVAGLFKATSAEGEGSVETSRESECMRQNMHDFHYVYGGDPSKLSCEGQPAVCTGSVAELFASAWQGPSIREYKVKPLDRLADLGVLKEAVQYASQRWATSVSVPDFAVEPAGDACDSSGCTGDSGSSSGTLNEINRGIDAINQHEESSSWRMCASPLLVVLVGALTM